MTESERVKKNKDIEDALAMVITPPATASTEGMIEKVARALARAYWQGRGETLTKEQEDEFWLSWGRDAKAALVSQGVREDLKTINAS